MKRLAGRRRRAGHGADLGDAAATLRELADKVPDLPAAPSAHRGDRAGRRHLADRWRGRAGRRRPGSGSIRAPPAIVEEFARRPRTPAHYETTGTGLNACQHGPARLA